jgi:drug/metabolite transporter, DME family
MTRPGAGVPLGALLVVAAAALWGTSGAAQELALPDVPPPAVAALRVLVGGTLLLALVIRRPGVAHLRAAVRRVPGATTTAAAAMGVFQIGYLGGIRLTGVAIGTLVAIGSAPVTAGLLDALRGRPPGVRWALATAVTICGTALLVAPGGDAAALPAGVALALAAGAAYATYASASKRLLEAEVEPTAAMALTFAGAGVLLAPGLLARDVGRAATGEGVVAVAWLGAVTITVGYVLFARGLRHVEAATATTLTLAEPLTAAVLAIALLGERFTGTTLAGALLVAAGLVVAGRGRRAPV